MGAFLLPGHSNQTGLLILQHCAEIEISNLRGGRKNADTLILTRLIIGSRCRAFRI